MSSVKLLKYVSGTFKENEATDDISFASFTGAGSGLTLLNATNISSGTLDKSRTDSSMASTSIAWNSGVLSLITATASGLAVGANGAYVDSDNASIGIVGGKLATLFGFKTITAPAGGSIVATNGIDTLNFTAGTDVSITNNPLTNTINITSSGSSTLTASKGVKRDVNDFEADYDSTLTLNGGNSIGIDLAHANVWTAAQTLSGFTGSKLIIDAATGDSGVHVFDVKNHLGISVASINELGDLICNDLQVKGAETVVGILSGSSLTLTGDLNVSGYAQINSTVVLGANSSDTVTFNGYVASNIVPSIDNTFDLGTSSLRWKDLYAVNISDGTETVAVANIADLSEDQTVTGNWSFDNNVILGSSSADQISFNGSAITSLVPSTSGTIDLGASALAWRTIYGNSFSNGTKTINFYNIPDKTGTEAVTGSWTFSDISLNNNFKVQGVSTTNMSAATLNQLTNGSNADSLHIHENVESQDVQLNFTASGAITAGQAVYISNTNAVTPADALILGTARVIGVAESSISSTATGYVTISGLATISGKSFTPGLPVYLSATTAGDLTQTAPTGVNVLVWEVGLAVSATDIIVAPKMGISLS